MNRLLLLIAFVAGLLTGLIIAGWKTRAGSPVLGMSQKQVVGLIGTNHIYAPNLILIDTNEFNYDWDHEELFYLLTELPPRRYTFNLRSNLIAIEQIKVQTNGLPYPFKLFDPTGASVPDGGAR